MGQIDNLIHQVKRVGMGHITITGGEPLLHPDIKAITRKVKGLKDRGYIDNFTINSNMILSAPPELAPHIINYSLPKNNHKKHHVSLLHPDDLGGQAQTYRECTHYRKETIVVTYQGCSICCAGDAYIRLFCMEDLILDYLPGWLGDFPLDEMDRICRHCPFGNEKLIPLERDRGNPISAIYAEEADKNWNGRHISKRFPEA
jgi:hypothetical protein